MTAPNLIWTADFKGQFRTRDGIYCYPLTVVDGYSRFLLGCQALDSTAHVGAQPVFRRLFQEFGLPQLIRTDNGVPFATCALARLSQLSVWWIRLGIYPELIEPSHPEQNGRHERMHRTLKAETTRPAAGHRASQQRRFNDFRDEFNNDRPHEALGQDTPASRYRPSPRPFPARLPALEYPSHYETRLVSRNGGIRWSSQWVNVSHVLGGEYVGLEEIDDGIWDVYFGRLKLGRFHERTLRIVDALGRSERRRLLPMSRPFSSYCVVSNNGDAKIAAGEITSSFIGMALPYRSDSLSSTGALDRSNVDSVSSLPSWMPRPRSYAFHRSSEQYIRSSDHSKYGS